MDIDKVPWAKPYVLIRFFGSRAVDGKRFLKPRNLLPLTALDPIFLNLKHKLKKEIINCRHFFLAAKYNKITGILNFTQNLSIPFLLSLKFLNGLFKNSSS